MNHQGEWLTNYITWKPLELEALAYLWPFDIKWRSDGAGMLYDPNGEGVPSFSTLDHDDEDTIKALRTLGIDENGSDDLDLYDYLHLAVPEGQNLVCMEIGHEGVRYLHGHSLHVTSKGIERVVDLEDIFFGIDAMISSF